MRCKKFAILSVVCIQSDDKTLRIWRTRDWQQEAVITEPFKEVTAIYISLEPLHDKTNKMTFAPSEDSDQPGHSLRCPHEETLSPQLPIERTAKTLIRQGRRPG